MKTDGECLVGTIQNLRDGVNGKPLSEAVLETARQSAIQNLATIIKHYTNDVAKGELGLGGTATASTAIPLSGKCPTGLLYGRVQSGKTLAMTLLTAAALDNGFRLVVVFTTNFLKLVDQTSQRFRAIDGRQVYSSTRASDLERDREHIRRQVARKGVVIVCAKDPTHIRNLIDLIDATKACDFPAMILDDEGDQATPDTTVRRRSSGRPNGPTRGSAIFRGVVNNDDVEELGQSVREKLRHNVFIQVTATPYALFLQQISHPLRPEFTLLIEPGEGYTGGEAFFSENHVDDDGSPPLVFVDENEADALLKPGATLPQGLCRAVSFFFLSATVRILKIVGTGAPGTISYATRA